MKQLNGLRILVGAPKDFANKDKVTKRCLEIANEAKFPTDYQDMYEHLFENEEAELFMVIDDNDEIYGFATCDNIVECNNTYLHGIIIHPDIQGMGFSVKLVREMLKRDGNEFFSARTHNPRIYEMMSKVAYDEESIYPNIYSREIPEEIWKVVNSHDAMKDADEDMIVRKAYPDEKVMQKVENEQIYKVFEKLNSTDAQVIVIRVKAEF